MGFNRYSLYTAAIGGVLLRDLTDARFGSASNKSIVIPGGDVHPRAIVQCCADPMLRFSTKDFANVFGGSPSINLQNGLAIHSTDEDPTAPTLLQFQKRADGSSFVGSGSPSHLVGTSTKGFARISSITARQDDVGGAKIGIDYQLLSTDGRVKPLTFSRTSALVNPPLFNGIFYLGPVLLGTHGSSTTLLPGVQEVSINMNIDYRTPRGDGNEFPVNGSVHAIVPEIRITTLDLGADIPSLTSSPWGNAFTNPSSSFLFFFWKGAHGSGRVAPDVAQHYMVLAQTGDNTTDEISVTELEDGTAQIVIRPTGGLTLSANQTIDKIS